MNNLYLTLLLFVFCATPNLVQAQGSMSLSVSPTLYEMTANPSQEWESVLRIINHNPYEITVYTDAVNFEPQGESGQAKFIPLEESEMSGQTLAEWIELGSEEFSIPPEQTLEIPFAIEVPEGAQPGGHFAAVLVGTKPPDETDAPSLLQTSQIVTSLVFLRITGDVIEDGSIREFRSVEKVVEKPEMSFELRFENKGNVHILPQGEIKIFNMWGQERGVIPVNRRMMFGNVLPGQIRSYSFTWSGEWSFADIGRYTAVATLAYGYDSKQFSDMETSFWVIPWRITMTVSFVIFGFIFVITWAIKLYIRKMLAMSGLSPDAKAIRNHPEDKQLRKISVVAPIGEGILDLSNRIRTSDGLSQKLYSLFNFVSKYKMFFVLFVSILLFVLLAVWFVQKASVDERAYEITIDTNGADIKLSSEQVEYDELKSVSPEVEAVPKSLDLPLVKLVNRSGVNGLAAEMRLSLENNGYEISELTSDLGKAQQNTVIVYHPEFSGAALLLSKLINDALLSSYNEASLLEPIVIYVGQDYKSDVQ